MDEDAWFKSPPPPPPPPGLAETLHAAPGPLFAVLDGAQFGDVAAELKAAGLSGRPLFLGEADEANALAGPWLAEVDNAARLDRMLAMADGKPAAVYWACPAGEAALYKHLRLINGAVVPLLTEAAQARQADAAAHGEAEEPGPADYADTRVLFRHYDPRVLAQVLPVLDERQFTQVLGPAAMVVIPLEGGPPLKAPALDPPVIVPNATLRLRPGQMDAIGDARAEQSRRRIMDYLREAAPPEMRDLPEGRLRQMVMASEKSGHQIGFTTERAQGKLAYLMMTSNGKFLNAPGMREYLTSGSRQSPDHRMDALMLSLASAATRMERH